MRRTVGIFIEDIPESGNYNRIELFNDEDISVNSTVQNIQDIAKTYTDFSQSFTIPASSINNFIFEHFYESDIDNIISNQRRRLAYIEIDTVLFRRGKIQLEKANIKNGLTENYSITFYGDGVTLKDKFSTFKLKDLDYSGLNHLYSAEEIKTRIESNSEYDVRYPLISSNREWINTGAGANDINTNDANKAVHFTELFPAVRDKKIFDLIQNDYGITFTGNILNDKRFKNRYTWFKFGNTLNSKTVKQDVDITNTLYNAPYTVINHVTNTIELRYTETYYANAILGNGTWRINMTVFNNTSLSTNYYIDVYVNGQYNSTVSENGNAFFQLYTVTDSINLNQNITFKVYSDSAVDFDFNLDVEYQVLAYDGSQYYYDGDTSLMYDGSVSLLAYIDLSTNAPDITIADYFSGILKEYNLTCYPVDENTYNIETLENWYSKGAIYDVTENIILDSIDIERIKLYKKIDFSYTVSESFLNKAFKNQYGREYGDLSEAFDYDGINYEIKVPFENLLHKNLGANLQVGYCLNNEKKNYIPKCLGLYKYDNLSCSFYFTKTTQTWQITNYQPFGQDIKYNNTTYSKNFGADESSLLVQNIDNSLYKTYYSPYIVNLFNKKNRLVKCKGHFPIRLITRLRLNDRLIIDNKRYFINNIKINITNSEVDLELIRDFGKTRKTMIFPKVPSGGGKVDVPIDFVFNEKGNKTDSVTLTPSAFLTVPSTTLLNEQIVEVTVASTENYLKVLGDETKTIYIADESNRYLIGLEGTTSTVHSLGVQWNFEDGSTESETIYITQ